MILYPSGDIYYGQHNQFNREGLGKLIEYSGGFQEGTWEQDKLVGPQCRIYYQDSGDYYTGEIDAGNRSGKGRMFEYEADEVYEGDFVNNMKQGDGKVYRRNGDVLAGEFRSNCMEGTFDLVTKLGPQEVEKLFRNAKTTNKYYISLNKDTQAKVVGVIQASATKMSFTNSLMGSGIDFDLESPGRGPLGSNISI